MMKKVRPWVEALGISEDDYQRWCANVPATESVTFRCLQEGRIPVEAYLDWASHFYEMPILKSTFFSQSPDRNLFEKLKGISSWSHEMVPVGEWDGVIYVACAEPNEDISWSFNVCYLLAAPAAIEAHWKTLTHVQAPVATPPPAPEEITKTAFPVLPNVPTPDVAATPDLSKVKKDDPFAAIEMQLTQPAVEIPEGITNVDSFAAPAGLAVPEAFAALVPEGLALPELPENTMTAVFAKPDLDAATTTFVAPVTAPPAEGNSLQALAQAHFRELKNDFVGCMLLTFDAENLKPIAWDESWKTTGPDAAFISLSNASAFRVVYRTKMPYLGHVVETPSNTEFFSAWGFAVLPETILVQPLIENGQWYGMLLLLADKNKKQSTLLTVAEQIAARLANLMAKAGLKAAA